MARVPLRIHVPGYIRFCLRHGDSFDTIAEAAQFEYAETGEQMTGAQLKQWYEAA
jgi:hypothetical protein